MVGLYLHLVCKGIQHVELIVRLHPLFLVFWIINGGLIASFLIYPLCAFPYSSHLMFEPAVLSPSAFSSFYHISTRFIYSTWRFVRLRLLLSFIHNFIFTSVYFWMLVETVLTLSTPTMFSPISANFWCFGAIS